MNAEQLVWLVVRLVCIALAVGILAATPLVAVLSTLIAIALLWAQKDLGKRGREP